MSRAHTVLVAEDKALTRDWMVRALKAAGYDVVAVSNVPEGAVAIETHMIDVAFLDLGLADGDGRDLLDRLHAVAPEVPVVIATANDTATSAVELLRRGAYDYVVKPIGPNQLLRLVERGIELCAARRALSVLRDARDRDRRGWDVGETSRMRTIESLVNRFAPTEAGILIQGESGTGKEVVARALHERSDRAEGPFVAINCAAIPSNLLESELFGHEKGAFTGAMSMRRGLLELAHRGTLFLDEVTSMPMEMQAKLLRALQEFRFRRVGGQNEISVDVRVLAASNQSVVQAIEEGSFRMDLFYRLCVLTIELPPLRERGVDIPCFIERFIGDYREKTGTSVTGVTEAALWALCRYRWPGNIRELRNTVERALIFATGEDRIDLAHLPDVVRAAALPGDAPPGDAPPDDAPPGPPGDAMGAPTLPRPQGPLPAEGVDLKAMIARWEQDMVGKALERTAGNQTQAARLLGLTRDELRYRVEKYAIAVEA
ncbi:MAG: sigma-54-dependent Fis family transcriptional regulator [Chloroflexi bacterium]|nr:sigma-54-dependent Fis family transcriptional regulator [Chloroflexota bacterium]